MSRSDSPSFEFVFGARSRFIYLDVYRVCVCAPRYAHKLVVLVIWWGGRPEYDASLESALILRIQMRGCQTAIFDSQRLNDYYMLSKISTQHLYKHHRLDCIQGLETRI
jgi:hypothetical protein